jgi:hypothetical protein
MAAGPDWAETPHPMPCSASIRLVGVLLRGGSVWLLDLLYDNQTIV